MPSLFRSTGYTVASKGNSSLSGIANCFPSFDSLKPSILKMPFLSVLLNLLLTLLNSTTAPFVTVVDSPPASITDFFSGVVFSCSLGSTFPLSFFATTFFGYLLLSLMDESFTLTSSNNCFEFCGTFVHNPVPLPL